MLDTIKLCLLGVVLIGAIAITWQVQDWRFEAAQKAALAEQAKQIEDEAKRQAAVAAEYEKQRESTNDVYNQFDKAIRAAKSAPGFCLDAERLRIVNSALSRKTAHPARSAATLPKAKATR